MVVQVQKEFEDESKHMLLHLLLACLMKMITIEAYPDIDKILGVRLNLRNGIEHS